VIGTTAPAGSLTLAFELVIERGRLCQHLDRRHVLLGELVNVEDLAVVAPQAPIFLRRQKHRVLAIVLGDHNLLALRLVPIDTGRLMSWVEVMLAMANLE
jgi:hypothetical protein